jgi:hypothetical protein
MGRMIRTETSAQHHDTLEDIERWPPRPRALFPILVANRDGSIVGDDHGLNDPHGR